MRPKAGFAATKPAPGNRLDSTSGAVQSYVAYLEDSHDRLLASVGAPNSKVYSFRYALKGRLQVFRQRLPCVAHSRQPARQ